MFSLNNHFSQVFVINMDKDTDRLASMTEQLTHLNTQWTRSPGIIPTKAERTSETTTACKFLCPNSVIGIYLAHKRIWEFVVEHNLPSALILEDDVILKENVSSILPNAVSELPPNWDLLYLGCFSCAEPTWQNSMVAGFYEKSIVKFSEHLRTLPVALGTEAYAISLQGAKNSLDMLAKVSFHLDFMITYTQLKRFAVYPQIAYQDGFDSSNNTSGAPILLNELSSKWRLSPNNPMDGRTVSWALSMNLFRLFHDRINVNSWTLIFLALACIPHAWKFLVLYLIVDAAAAGYHGNNRVSYTSLCLAVAIPALIRNRP